MKPIHIFSIIILLGGIALMIFATGDMSTYHTFDSAEKSSATVKIVGELAKDREISFDPVKNPNYLSFYMIDANGRTEKVIYHKPKPRDFELSEKVVLTGKYEDDAFQASDMLLKCPSKYKDEEIALRSEIK